MIFIFYNVDEYRVGEQNINSIPLVNRSNILIPPLHIKLGLFKNFVKALRSDLPVVEPGMCNIILQYIGASNNLL